MAVALCALLVLASSSSALAQTSEPPPQETKIDLWDPNPAPQGRATAEDVKGLADGTAIHRLVGDYRGYSNVAVFRFRLEDGSFRDVPMESSNPRFPIKGTGHSEEPGHSEVRLVKLMEDWGVKPEWLVAVYSERQFCANCLGLLDPEKYPNLRALLYSLDWVGGDTPEAIAIRDQARKALLKAVDELFRRHDQAAGIMSRRGQNAARKFRKASLEKFKGLMLENQLRAKMDIQMTDERFFPKLPGGIDFSSLELRYVGDDGASGLRYAMRTGPGAAVPDVDLGITTALQASNAFFTWLALPPQSFWVNLKPDEPDRIIDPQFARTDAGRVLLEADLLLKKSVAKFIHPDTPDGAHFWDEMQAIYADEPSVDPCFSFRQWIVPGTATVRETANDLYILDAPLQVKMETDYFGGGGVASGCQADPARDARKEDVFKRLVLPKVEQYVNTAPEFEPLRRVYLSRVAAEWYRRRRAAGEATPFDAIIGSGNIDRWLANPPWSPFDVYNQYLSSVRNGEFNIRHTNPDGSWTGFVYGGVDFSTAPRTRIAKAQLATRFPNVTRDAQRALDAPTADRSTNQVWLGADSAPTAHSLLRRRATQPDSPLRLGMTTPHSRVRVGQHVTYRITVANPTDSALPGVRLCDRLPSGLVYVSSSRSQRMRNGLHCWEIGRLGSHQTRSVRVTARVLNGARGRARNVATASAQGATGRAVRTVTIPGGTPGRSGGVTG